MWSVSAIWWKYSSVCIVDNNWVVARYYSQFREVFIVRICPVYKLFYCKTIINRKTLFTAFDKPFYGIVFSKGHYSNVHCVHLPAGLGRTSAQFEIGIHACGTQGNTENGLYGYGAESGSGTWFENIIVIQYDPQVQEMWDKARKLRCTWHDLYEKSVTFRPFPVDTLDVIRTDFAGDNVGCWMQIQVGKGI